MWAKQKQSGFTIVELLIVIVVIAILSAITIVAYNGIQERSKVVSANSDLVSLKKAIIAARINTGQNLILITGSNCTGCFDQARYELTLQKISDAAGINVMGLRKGDPWGQNYRIDENEGENGNCVKDSVTLLSVHPGVIAVDIPFNSCPN